MKIIEIEVPNKLHENTLELLQRFAETMAEKLHRAELKYGYSDDWKSEHWEQVCRDELNRHMEKGDPIDVALYCAFMYHHGWATSK